MLKVGVFKRLRYTTDPVDTAEVEIRGSKHREPLVRALWHAKTFEVPYGIAEFDTEQQPKRAILMISYILIIVRSSARMYLLIYE